MNKIIIFQQKFRHRKCNDEKSPQKTRYACAEDGEKNITYRINERVKATEINYRCAPSSRVMNARVRTRVSKLYCRIMKYNARLLSCAVTFRCRQINFQAIRSIN